jgi:hypothetical protein
MNNNNNSYISKKHKQAKDNLQMIAKLLFHQGDITKGTFDMVLSEIREIEDEPFGLLTELIVSEGHEYHASSGGVEASYRVIVTPK